MPPCRARARTRIQPEAKAVTGSGKRRDHRSVIALGGQVQALTQVISDQGELRAAVQSIQPSDSRASFGELARYVRTIAESAHLSLEVHLVSDLQKSALPPGFADLRIDPSTGRVTSFLDLKGILAPSDKTGREDVLNGIAYDSEHKRVFVTGKLWPRIFEIRVTK